MPFIGNTPDVNFTSFAKQDLTGVTGSPAKRGFTLTHAVANANEIEVFVNNVRQEPTEAYTVNGTGLTMTGDVETSDDFYIIYLGKAIQTTVPPDGSVSTAKIADSAVDLTSKVTGVLPVANGGTGANSMTCFHVTKSVDQEVADDTATVITFDVIADGANSGRQINKGGGFANNKFTVTEATKGIYSFYYQMFFQSTQDPDDMQSYLRKNGSIIQQVVFTESGYVGNRRWGTIHGTQIVNLSSSGDYVELLVYANCASSGVTNINMNTQSLQRTTFGGYRIGA
jgi:hypothetical protein